MTQASNHRATFGFADIELRRPVSASSIFRLASLTKPITAVAVLQLAERGEQRSSGARTLSPGVEWGPGVIVEISGTDIRERGSWGWSGAFGGHLVTDAVNRLTIVPMINRSNFGGADSEVSRREEEKALRAYGTAAP